MKKYIFPALIPVFLTVSCVSIFKQTITVKDAIAKKQEIDATDNPAKKQLIIKNLTKKRISLSNVTVRDITPSGNIDFDFCIVASVSYGKGTIDCYIYSTDLKTVAKLVKGKSRINARGDFGRFFTLLDSSYTKIEVINAKITILEDK